MLRTLFRIIFSRRRVMRTKIWKQEGATTSKIYFVGNIMIDSLKAALPKARQKNALADFGFQPKGYGLITLHRPSNVDLNEKLGGIVKALLKISLKIPLIFPIHPRTLKNLHNRRLAEGLKSHPRLKITQPLGYIDFINLMMNTCFVLTDSGGIQEETTFLGVPCLTLRDNTERPITLTQGTNELVKLPDLTKSEADFRRQMETRENTGILGRQNSSKNSRRNPKDVTCQSGKPDMKLDTKAALKDYIPPAVIKLFYFLGPNRYGWFGDYSSWEKW